MKKTILFICTHNSARSQLAEAIVNANYSENWQAYSAGTEKTFVKPQVIEAMKRDGVDISSNDSKTLEAFHGKQFDIVVTVCDNAKETCPFFPGKNVVHKSFEDPSNYEGSEEGKIEAFCKTRDEIKAWLAVFLPENLK